MCSRKQEQKCLVLRVRSDLKKAEWNNNSGPKLKESVDLSSYLSSELPKTTVKQTETLDCLKCQHILYMSRRLRLRCTSSIIRRSRHILIQFWLWLCLLPPCCNCTKLLIYQSNCKQYVYTYGFLKSVLNHKMSGFESQSSSVCSTVYKPVAACKDPS